MSGSEGVWRRTLVYLGLVEEPEEHDDLPEHLGQEEVAPARRREPVPRERAHDAGDTNVRPLRMPEPGAAHVRAMPPGATVRATVVKVAEFEDVESVGTRYRNGHPVIVDLQDVDKDVARRVLDFVSGVTFALRGRMAPAGRRVYLLVPEAVELPPEEVDRLRQFGYEVEL